MNFPLTNICNHSKKIDLTQLDCCEIKQQNDFISFGTLETPVIAEFLRLLMYLLLESSTKYLSGTSSLTSVIISLRRHRVGNIH